MAIVAGSAMAIRRRRGSAADSAAAPVDAKNTVAVASSASVSSSSSSSKNKIRLLFFVFRFSTGSLLPFMSLYMKHRGLGADAIGTLQAIRPIVTTISAPMWGGLADRTGKKKMVLVLAFVCGFLCRLFMWLSAGDIRLFAIALCISSIFHAPVTSLLDSMVVSSLSEEEKVNFGKLRLWGELGNGVASSIVMNIINRYERGFDDMFLLHGVSSAVALVFMLYCVPTPHESTEKPRTSQVAKSPVDWKEGLRVIFGNVQTMTVFGLVAITGFSMAMLEMFCYANIRELYNKHGLMDVAGRDISTYRMFFCLGGTLTWWFSGSWNKTLGPNVLMFSSVCCLPLCFFLYAGVGSDLDALTKLGFVVAEAVRSAIFAALWNAATIRLNKLSPPHMHSVMQTMLEATYRGIGHTSGSYLGGQVVKAMGVSDAYLMVSRGLISFLCVVGAVGFGATPSKYVA